MERERFADIDPEEFFDFQVTRPHVSLVDGTTRRIDWPETTFMHAPIPGLDRDAVILLGIEPNMRWRRFSDLVAGLADEVGVELVVTLGSLLADVPHTRPSPVTGSASDQQLIEELGLERSRYEGPTGIVGVLHDAFYRRGISAVNLWAAVPHYVSLAPSPRAALALCERLGSLLGASFDTSELREAVRDVRGAGEPGRRRPTPRRRRTSRSSSSAATTSRSRTSPARRSPRSSRASCATASAATAAGPKPPDDLPREQ